MSNQKICVSKNIVVLSALMVVFLLAVVYINNVMINEKNSTSSRAYEHLSPAVVVTKIPDFWIATAKDLFTPSPTTSDTTSMQLSFPSIIPTPPILVGDCVAYSRRGDQYSYMGLTKAALSVYRVPAREYTACGQLTDRIDIAPCSLCKGKQADQVVTYLSASQHPQMMNNYKEIECLGDGKGVYIGRREFCKKNPNAFIVDARGEDCIKREIYYSCNQICSTSSTNQPIENCWISKYCIDKPNGYSVVIKELDNRTIVCDGRGYKK